MDALRVGTTHDALVTVNDYSDGVMDGYLIHPRLGARQQIKSVSQLLQLLDQAQKLEDVPVKLTDYDGTVFENPNKIASFTVSVMFRNNHGMQGKLTWHPQSLEEVFRSELEFVYLIDDMLGEGSTGSGETVGSKESEA